MISALSELVERGEVVVLSGAGMSTASGIPDYRGSSGSRRKGSPMSYRQFVDDPDGRRRYWARSHVGWRHMSRAQPNLAHEGLAALEEVALVRGVITQNVDGLHQAAGSRSVIELHGALADTICLDCGDRRSRLELHHRLEAANPTFVRSAVALAPDGDAELPDALVGSFVVVECLACGGGALKPDVVFFGESVPRDRVETAFDWVARARSLLVLGSSLAVMSGYRFVLAAHRRGIPVAVVNLGPTRADQLAAVKIEDELCAVLTGLSRSIRRLAIGRG